MKSYHTLIGLLMCAVAVAMVACGSKPEPARWTLKTSSTHSKEAAAPMAQEPDGSAVHSLPTHVVPGRLRNTFNDSNALQLTAAVQNGIEPITSLALAYKPKQPLEHLATCKEFYVDSMRNAMPYLVPKAAQLLREMGKAFQDTIKARGGKEYRLRVNSMLRSSYSVAKLQRRNRAAVEQSCHLYGTTFDVSYVKFDCMDASFQVSQESLKNILAEIVYDFREKGRCYAIFESRQGCFHITAR